MTRLAPLALLLLGGCALFQQVPGRVTANGITTEAGGIYGESTPTPGGCPAIKFMGNQDVGKVVAGCTGNGAAQWVSAEAVTASTNLQAAINGQTALGQQLADIAMAALAALGAAGKVASGGLALPQPQAALELPDGRRGAATSPVLMCLPGQGIITLVRGRPMCVL